MILWPPASCTGCDPAAIWNGDPWTHTNIMELSNLLFLFSWVNFGSVWPKTVRGTIGSRLRVGNRTFNERTCRAMLQFIPFCGRINEHGHQAGINCYLEYVKNWILKIVVITSFSCGKATTFYAKGRVQNLETCMTRANVKCTSFFIKTPLEREVENFWEIWFVSSFENYAIKNREHFE